MQGHGFAVSSSRFRALIFEFRHGWRLIKAGGIEFSALCHRDRKGFASCCSVNYRQREVAVLGHEAKEYTLEVA